MRGRRILVVRHGESTWNAVRRWQGQADPPLSERGEKQARRAVIAAPGHATFDLVVTSTLERARRTGELIAAGLGIELGPAVAGLAERHAGEWQGLTRIEIEESYPGFLESGRRPPGYEPDESVVHRSGAALRGLASDHPESSILVVSHGGVVHALERDALGDDGWQRLDNLTGRWFEVDTETVVPTGDRVALVPDGGPAIPPPERGYA